jgi:hypothetical protein
MFSVLDAFAKLEKEALSFVRSVYPSARLGFQWTDISEN